MPGRMAPRPGRGWARPEGTPGGVDVLGESLRAEGRQSQAIEETTIVVKDNLLRGENRRVLVEGEGREGVTVQGTE